MAVLPSEGPPGHNTTKEISLFNMISEKNTKAQILDAYNELLEERNALESELKKIQKAQQERPPVSEKKTADLPSAKQQLAMENKMTATILTLSSLQLGFGSAISELSEKLTSKAARLQDLQSSVAQEEKKLATLHSLDNIQDDTLDTLIQSYTDHSNTFEVELTQRRGELEQEIENLTKAWELEQEEHKRSIKERDEAEAKRCQRDAQEYEYSLKLHRDVDQAEYEQVQKDLYQQLEDAKLSQEKRWAEREKTIVQQEQNFTALQTQVETSEQERETAIEAAKTEVAERANYEAKVKADLRTKELEGEKRVYGLRIQSLEQAIENNEEQIQTLSKQLDAALKQVQDLAVKAIEGSSNVQSYQALKEIALEQAKTQLKGK